MLLKMSVEHEIWREIIRNKEVKMTMEESDFIIIPSKCPSKFKGIEMYNLEMSVIIREIVQHGEAYIEYQHGSFTLWRSPNIVTLVLNSIVFLGYNNWGHPEFAIDNKVYSGNVRIWNKLFGGVYNKDILEEWLQPYIEMGKTSRPIISMFSLIKEIKNFNKPYPLMSYGDKKIKGETGLRVVFPDITVKEIKSIYKHIGWVREGGFENRAQHLINKYTISGAGPWIMGERLFETKWELCSYIRSKGDSISRETATKMFQELAYLEV